MHFNQLKNELQNILSRKSRNSRDSLIQTIANHIGKSKRTSPVDKEKHKNKAEETSKLISFAIDNNLIIESINEENFVASGAEQKVYIQDEFNVLKLNDAIYYASWEDYFLNLLLNNFFFPDTAYELIGFYLKNNSCYAVVKQPFVKADMMTDLTCVKEFLISNGFENTRNHDYYHPELGIILEDLHDENVLTKQNTLYFIDTVFYINPDVFWDEN